ncbi:MAG: 50S ribosomal protein L18 [Armatimonadetes bacterium]|nr:50S ribosomal protein L18 [Armatimonadota bacterium]
MKNKFEKRERRHRRVRKKVSGDAMRPRLSVFRSLNHIYAQVIDDSAAVTLASASTVEKDLRTADGGNIAAARAVGKRIAERAKEAGITAVRFDRGGFKYHGRIENLADAAREAGLQF